MQSCDNIYTVDEKLQYTVGCEILNVILKGCGWAMLKEEILNCIQGAKGNISVVLKNLDKDEWVLKLEEQRVFSSASTIKTLIAIEALNQVIQGKYCLDQRISIKAQDKVAYSIISDLNTDLYTYIDIITLMMIVSDNTATNILIDLLGDYRINEMAREIGLKNTVLQRKMMDFNAIKCGKNNLTSAMDMATILEMIYKKKILNEEMCSILINIMKKQRDKTMLARYIPEETIIAHKTGDLKNTNHDVGIFYLPGITYLLGVFVTDAENNSYAKKIIGKISKVVYNHFKEECINDN